MFIISSFFFFIVEFSRLELSYNNNKGFQFNSIQFIIILLAFWDITRNQAFEICYIFDHMHKYNVFKRIKYISTLEQNVKKSGSRYLFCSAYCEL